MVGISGLSDELLIKILSFLPTKVAVSTGVLSKQWEFLWMWMSKLDFSHKYYSESKSKSLSCFLNRNLPLHRAPVIETLSLRFCDKYVKPEDIKLWILVAVSRSLRELVIHYASCPEKSDALPSSLYTCKSLVTLKLKGTILVDVPRMVCLPCLKTLRLREVSYSNEGSLARLLSICPVFEDVSVKRCDDDNMGKLSVIVPSLRRLVICEPINLVELVISTPSLKYLRVWYYNYKSRYCLIENMPQLEKAHLDVCFPDIKNFISSITNVKDLVLCLDDNSEAVYGNYFVFNELEKLYLRLYQDQSLNALVRLLKVSPKLRVLDVDGLEQPGIVGWNQPSNVPECMLSSLEIFQWLGYLGRPEERDVAIYILENARRLKTARIFSEPSLYPTLDMLKELALCSRASSKCQLHFH